MATVYANSSDGSVGAGTTSWNGLHDASRGKNAYFTATHRDTAVLVSRSGGAYQIFRVFMDFDTSGITSAVSSATLKIYGKANGTSDLIVVKGTNTGTDGNTYNDLDGWTSGYTDSNLTALSSEVTSWSTSGYNDITLNSDALTLMKNEDTFKIAILNHEYDYEDDVPADGVDVSAGMYFTQETGTDKDPYIDYTLAATGYGNAILGVASANIGTVNGIATANVSKINGV